MIGKAELLCHGKYCIKLFSFDDTMTARRKRPGQILIASLTPRQPLIAHVAMPAGKLGARILFYSYQLTIQKSKPLKPAVFHA